MSGTQPGAYLQRLLAPHTSVRAHSWSLHTSSRRWGQYEEDAVPLRSALSLLSHEEQHTLLY
jgi:hypothetical protein